MRELPRDIRLSDRRRAYRMAFPLLLSLAAAAMVGGAGFLVFPGTWSESAIGDSLPFAGERLWAVSFMVGGGLVLWSTYVLDSRYEVAGLLLMAACYSTYFYALLTQRTVAAVVIAAPVFLGLSVGCTLRALILRYEPRAAPWRGRT